MIRFGFSYVGLIYLAMLFIPNGFWAKNKPEGYEEEEKKENKILLVFERTGEVLLCVLALIFRDTNVRPGSLWLGWLILSFAAMVLYEIYWIRYFKSPKTLADMYSPIAGFPVAGASLPVIAFFLLGIYASNIFLIGAAVIMGIGHIGIHMQHRKMAGIKSGRKKGAKITLGIVQVLVAVPVFIVIGISVFFIVKRSMNYFSCFIDPYKGIDEQTYIDINGQKQFISIRGKDKSNPVILFLHGGPLSPDAMVTYAYSNDLLDDYTFVCWDQRGCGRTYFANSDRDNSTVSFEQALDDLDVLTDYLCERFGCEKIIILGHSYGTVLGSRYVFDHPEKVLAYIGAGQFVNAGASLKTCYDDALAKAEAQGDDTSYMKLAYNNYLEDPSYYNYNAAFKYCSGYHNRMNTNIVLLQAFESPYLASDDFKWLLKDSDMEIFDNLAGDLVDTCQTIDLREQNGYQVPVYFISGSDDWSCSYVTMTEYASLIGADYKLIENANHNVQADAPHEFSKAVKDFLKTAG
ncbi:MAG: alpha/beta hydrolase [Saccharofermentans sp.]|nr:alpha/beta hydrolase [Saccharofermentans sp.]